MSVFTGYELAGLDDCSVNQDQVMDFFGSKISLGKL